MSQKDYNYKIIAHLLRSESHIRELARIIGTNQTTIARKARELCLKNILDFRQEGRNKVFFIKRSLEARHFVYQVENNRLIGILSIYPQLRRIIELIQKNNKIGLAILFGSYAKGTANKDSDIDIYIDTKNQKIKSEIESIDSKISVKIGKFNKESLLIKEIIKNHIVIKGPEEYYAKNRFFE